jgi:hypothetical protein
MSKSINQLINSAKAEGLISQASAKVLSVVDIGKEIEAGLGVNIDDVKSSEVVLVTIMPDDSGSIRFGNNTQAVRDGHNQVVDALRATKQADSILAHNRYLNGDVLYPYQPINQAVLMDSTNFDPCRGTPLYDQTVVLLGTVLVKAQEFAENGVPVRTVTLIITDGADEHSVRSTAKDCASLIRDMLKSENHIIAAMGLDNGTTDFRQVFQEMGIRDEWILTPGNTPHDIRQAFRMFSQSAVRASQSAANFSKTAVGGFGGTN